jgi:hypothetical protein
MAIIWMVASVAFLAILAALLRRRIIFTVIIGILLFMLFAFLGSNFFRIPTGRDVAVFYFAVPAVLLAIIFGPRKKTELGPFVRQGEADLGSVSEAPAAPDLSNDAFLSWLEANGYTDQEITPEQMRAYRTVFRKEMGVA